MGCLKNEVWRPVKVMDVGQMREIVFSGNVIYIKILKKDWGKKVGCYHIQSLLVGSR